MCLVADIVLHHDPQMKWFTVWTDVREKWVLGTVDNGVDHNDKMGTKDELDAWMPDGNGATEQL